MQIRQVKVERVVDVERVVTFGEEPTQDIFPIKGLSFSFLSLSLSLSLRHLGWRCVLRTQSHNAHSLVSTVYSHTFYLYTQLYIPYMVYDGGSRGGRCGAGGRS